MSKMRTGQSSSERPETPALFFLFFFFFYQTHEAMKKIILIRLQGSSNKTNGKNYDIYIYKEKLQKM